MSTDQPVDTKAIAAAVAHKTGEIVGLTPCEGLRDVLVWYQQPGCLA